MRATLLSLVAATLLIGVVGLPFSASSSLAPAVQRSVVLPPAARTGIEQAKERAFPNCPAPAVEAIRVREDATVAGTRLTVFVIVQNVGNRSFSAGAGVASLQVVLDGRLVRSLDLVRLSPGEVQVFTVQTEGAGHAGDVAAGLVFAPGARVGAVSDTLDCRTADNALTQRAPALSVPLGRRAS